MKLQTVDELVNQNFNPVFVNALQQHWRTTKLFHCIGTPKKQNLFLLLDGCKITYTDKENNTFVANSGDIVYTPIGSEYKAQLSDFQDSNSHTIGINFFLYDEKGESIILSDKITIFRNSQNRALPFLFRQALCYDANPVLFRNRIILMEILGSLVTYTFQKEVSAPIAKVLRYMAEHIEENPTITELAAFSNVSEVYFRKQFKSCIGMTPIEYRNSLRLDRARSYLEYGDISIQEISDTLGYSTVSHFIKVFKNRYLHSPLKYRKLCRENIK